MDKNIEKELNDRIITLEVQNKNIIHRVSNLEEDKEILHKMEALMEVSVSTQKDLVKNIRQININQGKYEEQLINFNHTLNKVNENMTNLNSNQQNIKMELVSLKDDVSDNQQQLKKVEELANNNRDKGKFDMTKFLSDDVPKYVFIAIIASVLALIGLK